MAGDLNPKSTCGLYNLRAASSLSLMTVVRSINKISGTMKEILKPNNFVKFDRLDWLNKLVLDVV